LKVLYTTGKNKSKEENSKHLFFRDGGKYIILLFIVAAISVHPKPMVGGVFGEDGRKSALLQMTSPIIGHNGKKGASNISSERQDKNQFIFFLAFYLRAGWKRQSAGLKSSCRSVGSYVYSASLKNNFLRKKLGCEKERHI